LPNMDKLGSRLYSAADAESWPVWSAHRSAGFGRGHEFKSRAGVG
jgi:hypothetical protein